jgi:hypothetical protein
MRLATGSRSRQPNDGAGRRPDPNRHGQRPENHPMEKIRIEQHSAVGTLWFAGWLFTIGYLHLSFGKGVLAIVLWAYYLGLTFSSTR